MSYLLHKELGRIPRFKVENDLYHTSDECMDKHSLREKILKDLELLGIPINEFDFELRPYSKSYYGNYLPKGYKNRKKACVRVYPFKNRQGEFYPYAEILVHAIHESCHHLQYRNPRYKRLKGIMHDTDFYRLMNRYIAEAESMNLIRRKSA